MTPYREPAEMPEEPRMKMPLWHGPLVVGIASILLGGASIDGCLHSSGHQGLFGSAVVLFLILAIGAGVVAADRAFEMDRARDKAREAEKKS